MAIKMKLLSIILLMACGSAYAQNTITIIPPATFDAVTGKLSVDLSSVNTLGNQVAALANQTSANQLAIAQLQAGAGVGTAPVYVSTATYKITNANAGQFIIFQKACTVTFATDLLTTFKCTMQQQSSQVVFSGININSIFSWKKIQSVNGVVTAQATSTGVVTLYGNLKN